MRDFWIGTVLTVVYLAQGISGVNWQWLNAQQERESFKIVTGLILLAHLIFQWLLPLSRMQNRQRSERQLYALHKQIGAYARILLYIHSTEFGFGYLLILSVFYSGNLLLGLFNYETLGIKNKSFRFYWMVIHVSASVFISALVLIHLVIALIYQ